MESKMPQYAVGRKVQIVSAKSPEGTALYMDLEPYVNVTATVIKTEGILPIMGAHIIGTDPLRSYPPGLFYVYAIQNDKDNRILRAVEESLVPVKK